MRDADLPPVPELDLAQLVALPTNLEPADLRQHLVDKKTAQEKLREYYKVQVDFLDQGGTIAGFLRQQERGGGGGTVTESVEVVEVDF